MPTPYWGALPSPVVMAERRRSSATSEDTTRGSSQLPRQHRTSTQTEATFDSPFGSPVESVFPQGGLAPRPPSLHNVPQGHEKDFQEKRRRRERDRSQYYEDEALPAAPDAPRNAPPISYKSTSNGKQPVSPNTTRSRSVREKGATEGGRGRRRLSREETGDEYPTIYHPEPRSSEGHGRGRKNSVGNGEAYLNENVTVQRGSSKRGSVHRPSSSSTAKDIAQDRSPLQRLERTLSEAGKEEKREKLRRAESLAKEREVEREVEHEAEDNNARNRDRSATIRPNQANKGERIPPSSSSGPRNLAPRRDQELLQPHPPAVYREAAPADIRVGRSQNRDELKAKVSQERSFSRPTNSQEKFSRDSSVSRPQTGDNRRQRSNSFRNRVSTAAAGTAAAIGITRTNSNRLKKEPPGDPWFNIRMEAEKVGNQRAQSQRKDKPLPEDHEYDSIDELEGLPVRSNSARKIQQLTGDDIGPPPRKGAPQQQQLYADNFDRPETLAPPPSDRSHPDNHHHHHLSNIIHRDRHHYQPGKGLYAATRNLNEWRKPAIARLAGSLLDMDHRPPESERDNKTWWEAGNKGPRKGSSLKPVAADAYDGAYDDTRGRVPIQLSDSFATSSTSIPNNPSSSWTKGHDLVLPRARQYIGYQGTSDNLARIKRRNRSWLLQKAKTASPKASKIFFSPILSPYSSTYLSPSQHKLSHPFHVCSPENISLTRSMRSIRIRSNIVPTKYDPPLFVKCGPLLRYCGIRRETFQSRTRPDTSLRREIWRGTVMIVTTDAESKYLTTPTLRLFLQPLDLMSTPPEQVDGSAGELAPEHVDPIAGVPKIGRTGETKFVRPVEHLEEELDLSRDETDDGLFESHRSKLDTGSGFDGNGDDPRGSFAGRQKRRGLDGEKAGKFKEVPGVRLHAELGVTFWRFHIEVELRPQQQRIAYRINGGPATAFWVPARGQSMNIMFHSCNGFSMSVNPDQFSGPDPMWRDVLNTHQSQPFHVMLGGGDQLYNDAVMKQTDMFQEWLGIRNPHEKHHAPFTPHLQEELEAFYLERYAMWFSQGLFGLANSQIPMVNIYDDHDIIDGFGSYPHHFMLSPVFAGLGAVAFKYYMLFQHQSIIDEGEDTEPSWILGAAPGPYIKELSRSVFLSLGREVAFLGLDCRTERMRDEVVTHETYDKVLDRCEAEIVKGETKHLIVLLGVPIAYPRLVWLENILTSRIMDPIKAVGKTGIFGNFLNQFDGGVEVLDDLDDHWTARNHKEERNWFVRELQHLAAEKSIRVTILGGDVHLAAIGQFYSNPKLGIPKDRDHRYMPNVISSAIVNTPPPEMMADVLNKRNKVHHLDHETDEDMIPIFTHDVNGNPRNNKRLLPRRNWCSIRPYVPGTTPPQTPSDRNTPSPPLPPAGLMRRPISSRGPTFTSDAPPVTNRGRSESSHGRHSRSMSLTRNMFRRSSRRRDSGGINGYEDDSDEESPSPPQQPGFSSEQQLSRPTPFHRTPTGLSEKQRKAGLAGPINLEHGLEVTLNVEVSQKDPAGITVPYKLLVPALSYEKNDSWEEVRRPSALSRFVSFGRSKN